MKGFGGGMQQLMKQANQMQTRMKKAQAELAEREFEGSSGGNAVTVKVKGDNFVCAVLIKEDVLKAGDAEMLQDLILTATNEAIKLAKKTTEEEMAKITGGAGIPGLF